MIETLWLGALLLGLAAWTIHGNRQYLAFRQLTDSSRRSAAYLRWAAESFVVLTGASLITLLLLGHDGSPFTMPELFHPLSDRLADDTPTRSGDGAIGFAIGMAMALAVLGGLYYFRLRRVIEAVSGDIEPLLPRTTRERISVVPLCLNAGFSEELFFRLALPLLVAEVTGSVPLAFAVAVVAFGLMHSYQGWKGIAATMLLGAFLTLHYLANGSLLWLMVAHAVIDLVALIVRPMIAARIARWRRPAAA